MGLECYECQSSSADSCSLDTKIQCSGLCFYALATSGKVMLCSVLEFKSYFVSTCAEIVCILIVPVSILFNGDTMLDINL